MPLRPRHLAASRSLASLNVMLRLKTVTKARSRVRAATLGLACPLVCSLVVIAPAGAQLSPGEAAMLRRDDSGVYVHYCPQDQPAAPLALAAQSAAARVAPAAKVAAARAHTAMANHDGWPPDECLKMDKGSYGASHTLVGLRDVHNWLLGGYGNDTVYGGEAGDVIWADYQPSGQSEAEVDRIHAGNGEDWIYSSHGYNEIWTGAGNDHLALVYGHGVIYCNGKGLKTFVMRYLPQNRPWRLVGCTHKVIDPYRA